MARPSNGREQLINARAEQQGVVARLGLLALENPELTVLLGEAVRAVAESLGVAYSEVLLAETADGSLRLVSGWGWPSGIAGAATIPLAPEKSQAGYTFSKGEPVVVDDLQTDGPSCRVMTRPSMPSARCVPAPGAMS